MLYGTATDFLRNIEMRFRERTLWLLYNDLDRILNELTWQEMMEHLRESFLPEGKVRDGIMSMLRLRDLQGLDGDLTIMFEGLKGENLDELREEALPIAVGHMVGQIRKGNTFFLEPTKMAENPLLATLVPKILEVRQKQMLNLPEKPSLTDVYSTYYGFLILTQGSLESDLAGVTEQAKDMLSQVAYQLGSDIDLKNKQLKYSNTAFGRVSEDLRNFLWNLLCVAVAGRSNRLRAIRKLGKYGDSRALDILHSRLFKTDHELTRRYILRALKDIGHPSSYEVLETPVSENSRTRIMQQNIKQKLYSIENEPEWVRHAVGVR